MSMTVSVSFFLAPKRLLDGGRDFVGLLHSDTVAAVGFRVELVVRPGANLGAVVNAGFLRRAVGKVFYQTAFHRQVAPIVEHHGVNRQAISSATPRHEGTAL